jgi:Undecaprenyl-phosphate galactose phosphotransferase WbaP
MVLDERGQEPSKTIEGIPVIRSRLLLEDITARQMISYVIFVEGKDSPAQEMRERLSWLSNKFRVVLVVLADSPLGSLWVSTMDLEGRLTLKGQYHLLDKKATFIKRAFDIFFGLILLIFFSPIFLIVALLVKIDSPGPVFYSQKRLGLDGLTIKYFKFRTMRPDAEERLTDLLQSNPAALQEYQNYHKLAKDPRITRVGRILRKYSLDELPQLWQVLRGELSLVGPRAYLPREQDEMGSYANLITRIRPGITGWWQVMGRHEISFQRRLQLDEYYISNWSLWLDVYILIKTGWVLLSGQGV